MMRIHSKPQVTHEIHRIDSLIRQLEGLHSEAKGLHDYDFRESVAVSIDEIIESLRDQRTKMEFFERHHFGYHH